MARDKDVSTYSNYESRDALFAGLATVVAAQLADALGQNGRATLAVPGGTTPAPFFEILRKVPLDWKNVTILLTDERFVPETSDRSNTRLLRETLFQDLAAAATYVPMYLEADQPEDVLGALQKSIAEALPLDICVLGMGADMHTASIFPEADLLAEALADDAPIFLPMRAPNAPEPRMTLTAPVLRRAGHVHLLIAGTAKKAALAVAQQDGPIIDAPVRAILPQAHIHYAD
ncbi:MAG: 6-phosphogluconolactonase [Amylibacter sp.]|jgi:6-phosphogluconolactonase|nr:6-phosphogluconolactonase [Amylibacter sp.]